MKKWFMEFLATLFFFSFSIAFAGGNPPTVTPSTAPTPMAAPRIKLPNFMGKWVIATYNGTRIAVSGSMQSIPYAEMEITISSGQMNNDGSVSYTGVVDGEFESSVSIYYNPVDKKYVNMYIYIPDTEFGMMDQYTQTELKVFLAPKANDFLHGTMSSHQQSLNSDNAWVTRSLFTGQVDIHRPLPPTPVVGGKG